MTEQTARRKSEIMMPVSDDHALRQFELEALRQITDNLQRLNDKMDDHGKKMTSLEVQMARIESGRLDGDVAAIRETQIKALERISALELDRGRREGATGVIGTILKSPAIGWLVGAVITAWAVLTGKVQI